MRAAGWWLAVTAILAVAAGLRTTKLGARLMHGDEAIHAWKLAELRTTGRYEYDPHEYHGPTLYYFTLPALWLARVDDFAGLSEAMVRLTPALFGVAGVGLALALRRGIGAAAALWAGLFMALSPILTFYSRYFIQESLLATFVLGAITCGWRFALRGVRSVDYGMGWMALGGVCVGLAHATKETCVISFAAAAAALLATRWLCGRSARSAPFSAWRALPAGLAALAAAVVTSVVCYSCFGQNPRGVFDSLATYETYFHRATAEPQTAWHHHPWWYYLRLLGLTHLAPGPWWSEGLLLALAGLGLAFCMFSRGRAHEEEAPRGLLIFLCVFTALLTVAYSAVPYKTPWCAVQFIQPMTLIAGVGVARLLRAVRAWPLRATLALGALAGAGQLGWQAYLASFRYPNDNRNPYVYAHPLRDVERLASWVERLASAHPDDRRMLVRVIAENSWPLPWYLRRMQRVGYWESVPQEADAPVVIVERTLEPAVRARLTGEYHVSYYGLRPDAQLSVFVRMSLYEVYRDAAAQSANGVAP